MGLNHFYRAGNIVELGSEIGRGAEGSIFKVIGYPLICAKIYTDKLQRDPERFEKITYMVHNPPSNIETSQKKVQIAWPCDILFSDSTGKSFAGFVMPLVNLNSYKPAHYYYCPTDREDNNVLVNWDHALVVSRNIATVLDSLHQKGYCVGDLQSNNILVNLNANVAFIDCDSFQVTDNVTNKIYFNTVGLAEYTPPELIGKDLKQGFDRKYSDLFALGTIIFQFLMQNALPYQAVGPGVEGANSPAEKIVRGLFSYGNYYPSVRPPDDVPSWKILSPSLQDFFIRCFIYGHSDPGRRPSAREWVTVIDNTRMNLTVCDLNVNHKFLKHHFHCPWCHSREDYYPDRKTLKQRKLRINSPGGGPVSELTVQAIPSIKPTPQRKRVSQSYHHRIPKKSMLTYYAGLYCMIFFIFVVLLIMCYKWF